MHAAAKSRIVVDDEDLVEGDGVVAADLQPAAEVAVAGAALEGEVLDPDGNGRAEDLNHAIGDAVGVEDSLVPRLGGARAVPAAVDRQILAADIDRR